MTKVEFTTQPKQVGGYRLDPVFSILLSVKPSAWHRYWVRTLLGWKWFDA